MRVLDLSRTNLQKIEFRQELPYLRELIVPGTLKDIVGIGNLTRLQYLMLRNTQISSLTIDQPMPNLKELELPINIISLTIYDKAENWKIHQGSSAFLIPDFRKNNIYTEKRKVVVHFVEPSGAASNSSGTAFSSGGVAAARPILPLPRRPQAQQEMEQATPIQREQPNMPRGRVEELRRRFGG